MKDINYNSPGRTLWKHYRHLIQNNQPTNYMHNDETDNQQSWMGNNRR